MEARRVAHSSVSIRFHLFNDTFNRNGCRCTKRHVRSRLAASLCRIFFHYPSLLIRSRATVFKVVKISNKNSFNWVHAIYPDGINERLSLIYAQIHVTIFPPMTKLLYSLIKTNNTHNSSIRCDKGLTLGMSAFQIFQFGNSTFINLLIKPNFCFALPPTQHHSFFTTRIFLTAYDMAGSWQGKGGLRESARRIWMCEKGKVYGFNSSRASRVVRKNMSYLSFVFSFLPIFRFQNKIIVQ